MPSRPSRVLSTVCRRLGQPEPGRIRSGSAGSGEAGGLKVLAGQAVGLKAPGAAAGQLSWQAKYVTARSSR